MRTADFNFNLPPELIAQHPAAKRDAARLLVLRRDSGQLEHRNFASLLDYLRPGDLLVLNDSRVIPARLRGVNVKTGGAFEILLLEENSVNDWWVMLKPGKRARADTQIEIQNPEPSLPHRIASKTESQTATAMLHPSPPRLTATVIETNAEGHRRLRFSGVNNVLDALEELGEVPLPPYIRREPAASDSFSERTEAAPDPTGQKSAARAIAGTRETDRERYQTVFAQPPGSVAAPTAGLHFTPELLDRVRARGVETHFVTLHVGLATFAPVKAETLEAHVMHEERYEIPATTARAVNQAKAEGRRVIAVGTTSVRVLESAAREHEATASDPARLELAPGSGRTKIFIHPPHTFKIVDALLTNFHLPCSTLLMLASAFATPGRTSGREMILAAYAEAIRERYRFFSYGDAMFIF